MTNYDDEPTFARQKETTLRALLERLDSKYGEAHFKAWLTATVQLRKSEYDAVVALIRKAVEDEAQT